MATVYSAALRSRAFDTEGSQMRMGQKRKRIWPWLSHCRAVSSALALAAVLALTGIWTCSAAAQTYTVLHSFAGPTTDGANPFGALARDPAGNLYGTTIGGGAFGFGVVFKLDSTGKETVLYNFAGGADGGSPYAGPIRDSTGNLYGTTLGGGASGFGVVFKLDATGKETVLYSFSGGADGANPYAGLVRDSANNLYGTTFNGGSGFGVVFKLDSTGHETVLHTFTGGADGANPYAGSLIRDPTGNLYGTTNTGGAGYGFFGRGVVFKLDSTGDETVLHTFTGGADGANPYSGLVRDPVGNLYGGTLGGGAVCCGVVFKLDETAKETVLHSFTGGVDGADLMGLFRNPEGTFYGTTSYGALGFGTVFKLDSTGKQTTASQAEQTGQILLPVWSQIRKATSMARLRSAVQALAWYSNSASGSGIFSTRFFQQHAPRLESPAFGRQASPASPGTGRSVWTRVELPSAPVPIPRSDASAGIEIPSRIPACSPCIVRDSVAVSRP